MFIALHARKRRDGGVCALPMIGQLADSIAKSAEVAGLADGDLSVMQNAQAMGAGRLSVSYEVSVVAGRGFEPLTFRL